ncbi:keratin, type I cytoskeletal 19-like [Eleutherodactylus coqui]|uniref:keratin, type I cytoskeletal 19-like n=1 Tax=Eleutherodactylus coqui TaxID=57060 RepID=UPI0034630C2F
MANRIAQESHGSAGSNRIIRAENSDDGSQQISSSGAHDEYRSQSRTSTAYHGEDSGSAYGSSGSSSTARHRGGSDAYSSGQTGSSSGYTAQSGNYGASSGGYRSSSGTSANTSAHGTTSSTNRVGFSGTTSSASRSGNTSGGFSSRSTGAHTSRSSAGRQGFGSSFGGASGGMGGFSAGSLSGGSRGNVIMCSSGCIPSGDGLLQLGEKETMQNLNSRLSSYMDKVRALEESNTELEDLIRNWYETHKPKKIDNSKYYQSIEDLREKILGGTLDNNELNVEVDNARLAADDFKVKHDGELNMRQSVEADIEGLRKVLDDLTLEKSSLESQVENLREEIAFNKKSHDEEMKALQGQSSDVNVQVDAAPGINILRVLSEMRAQYEEMAEENRKKTESDYNQKLTELSNEISYSNAENETGKSELTELRRTLQTLEIELQSQLAMKCTLETSLAETQTRYATQLAQIQEVVLHLEDQLGQVRNDMENQSCEYKLLLDIKTRLENEIEMYRRLLDGESGSSSGSRAGSRGGFSGGSSSGSSGGYAGASRDGSSSVSNAGMSRGSSSGSVSASGGMSSGMSGGMQSNVSSGASSSVSTGAEWSSSSDPKKNRLVTTITEERVDGRLVSSKIDKVAQKI